MGFLTSLATGGLAGGGIAGKFASRIKERKREGQDDPTHDYGQGAVSYAKGGKVRKTGLAKLHKGERVLTKRQTKRWRRK